MTKHRANACAAFAFAIVACGAAAKPPLAEPQAPQPFASVVVECPPKLEEKPGDDKGVFTAEVELKLGFVRATGEAFDIPSACDRRARPLHLPPGNAKLEAGYKEQVKQHNSVLETPVSCELPTLSQSWEAGKTYFYRVTVTARDAHGRFNSCNVTLSEQQPSAPASSSAAPAPSSSQ
jgi:hypothetical protein